jgi:copper transport protein
VTVHAGPSRRAAVVLAALLAGLLLPVVLAAPASAHATLQETSPDNGQVVATSPATVRLRFDEPVEVALGGIAVLSADGTDVTVGKVRHVAGAGSLIAIGLRPHLAAGSYLVNWRVQSADSHPIDGAFIFSVGAPGQVAAEAAPTDQSTLVALLALARFSGYAGLMLGVGTFAFLLLCWPEGWGDAVSRTLLWSGLGAAGGATLLDLLLQGSYVAGGGLGSVLNPGVLADTADTRFGRVLALRLLLLLGVAVALRLTASGGSRAPARSTQLGIGAGFVAVLVTLPLSGHAGSSNRMWLDVPLDLTHLTAVSVWMGGLVVLGVGLIRRRGRNARDDGLSAALPRFSQVALVCVGVLVLSGAVVGWREVGSVGALLGTSYGLLLIGKVMVLGVILSFAALSRKAVGRRVARPGKRLPPVSELSALRRSVSAELSLGVIVVVLTSTLVSLPPARTQYRPTTRETVAAGPVLVTLTADPTGPRLVDLRLATNTRSGDPRKLPELRTTATLPGRGISVPVTLRSTGAGRYRARGVSFPVAGTWRVQFYARTTDVDSYTASTTLTVR